MVSGRLVMVSGRLVMSSPADALHLRTSGNPITVRKRRPEVWHCAGAGMADLRREAPPWTPPGGPVLWGHTAWWPRAVGSHRLVAPCCGVTPPGGPVLWGHTAWWPRAVGSHRLVAPCCGVTPPGGPLLLGHLPTPYGRMAVTPLTTGHAPDWGDNERLPTGHRRAVMARSCPACSADWSSAGSHGAELPSLQC